MVFLANILRRPTDENERLYKAELIEIDTKIV